MSDAPWTELAGPIGDEGPEDEYVLAVEGLYKRFGEGPELYHDLHLRIRRGEIVVIVGESGIGKSVFLKHLIGLEEASSGGIWYRTGGKSARDWPVHLLEESEMADIRREISMVFQASSLFDWMTVRENIALPLEEHREKVRARFAAYMEDPSELLVILRRAQNVPGAFSGIAQATTQPREALKSAVAALASGGPDADRALVNAFGADAAEDLPAARTSPAPRSAWKDAGVLAAWCSETLGDLLVSVDPTELTPDVATFRAGYMEARRALRAAWAGVRRGWQGDFGDLAALLAQGWLAASGEPVSAGPASAQIARVQGKAGTPDAESALAKVVADWAKAQGVGLPAGAASGAERIRQALSLLKVRPSLLADALDRAGTAAPATFAPVAAALETFEGALQQLETALAENAKKGEGDVLRAILLGWLAVRPMAVDRSAKAPALLRAIVESFADRPEELGLMVARRGASGPLAPLTQAYDAFRAAFVAAFKSALPAQEDEQVDAFTELVVNGLMASVKLNVAQDREKLPSELSGGMRTRVGLARSLATLPSVVLYDEPTAGLDPVLSQDIAREILELQTAGIVSTSIVVTHDKDLYGTLKMAGRVRMLYLSGGRFLDVEARPVRDPLRPGDTVTPADPVRQPGVRGYAPERFIEEFEPRQGDSTSPR